MTDNRSLESLTAADFHGSRGLRFRVTGSSPEGSPVVSSEVELADVTEHPADAEGTFRTPFSVIFHGPIGQVLPQGIYRLEQEQFGTVELFIVPIGPDEAATVMRYEAVFS